MDVNDGTRWKIEAARSNIAGDANDRERLQVAVHIAELDHLTNGVLIAPALASQRFTDHCNVRRIPIILFAEHPPAEQRNAHGAEVRLASDGIKGMSDLGRILSNTTPFIEIGWRLLAIEDQEISLSEIVAGRDGKGAGQ